MEFRFNVNEIFNQPIAEIGHTLIPAGFKGDRRQLWDTVSKVTDIVNAMGTASANAQSLTKSITTADRLRNSEQQLLYLMVDQSGNQGKGAITGMLKTGRKGLYVFDRDGHHFQVQAPCILDFYVHESRQRSGYGKKLFEYMLQREEVEPKKLAIDRPSDKFLAFLNKHYTLNNPIRQMNNFVVYDGFFPKDEDKKQNGESPHRGSNGLQAQILTSPYGRYGARRPPCSMGQIIHNQSSAVSGNEQSGDPPVNSFATSNIDKNLQQSTTNGEQSQLAVSAVPVVSSPPNTVDTNLSDTKPPGLGITTPAKKLPGSNGLPSGTEEDRLERLKRDETKTENVITELKKEYHWPFAVPQQDYVYEKGFSHNTVPSIKSGMYKLLQPEQYALEKQQVPAKKEIDGFGRPIHQKNLEGVSAARNQQHHFYIHQHDHDLQPQQQQLKYGVPGGEGSFNNVTSYNYFAQRPGNRNDSHQYTPVCIEEQQAMDIQQQQQQQQQQQYLEQMQAQYLYEQQQQQQQQMAWEQYQQWLQYNQMMQQYYENCYREQQAQLQHQQQLLQQQADQQQQQQQQPAHVEETPEKPETPFKSVLESIPETDRLIPQQPNIALKTSESPHSQNLKLKQAEQSQMQLITTTPSMPNHYTSQPMYPPGIASSSYNQPMYIQQPTAMPPIAYSTSSLPKPVTSIPEVPKPSDSYIQPCPVHLTPVSSATTYAPLPQDQIAQLTPQQQLMYYQQMLSRPTYSQHAYNPVFNIPPQPQSQAQYQQQPIISHNTQPQELQEPQKEEARKEGEDVHAAGDANAVSSSTEKPLVPTPSPYPIIMKSQLEPLQPSIPLRRHSKADVPAEQPKSRNNNKVQVSSKQSVVRAGTAMTSTPPASTPPTVRPVTQNASTMFNQGVTFNHEKRARIPLGKQKSVNPLAQQKSSSKRASSARSTSGMPTFRNSSMSSQPQLLESRDLLRKHSAIISEFLEKLQ